MRWASAISTQDDTAEALLEVLGAVVTDVPRPHLAFVFLSPRHLPAAQRIGAAIRDRLPGARVVGCSGGGIVGGGREVERAPALSLTVASLPGVRVTPSWVRRPDALAPPAAGEVAHHVVLADPFTMDAGALVAALDDAFPDGVTVGGLASGGRKPGEHALLLDDRVHHQGAVLVRLSGSIRVDAVVAQGCRPVGDPMFVTRCDGQLLLELDGRPATDTLEGVAKGLDAADRALAQQALYLGLVMDPSKERYGPGDFLVRNLLGADPERGLLAVGARLRPKQVVQFHVRDAVSAAADLRGLLAAQAGHPSGALLFSCLGRGVGLYGAPDYDTGLLQARFGDLPMGGFFCNGEIGPVHDRTWLHGYTSAFALFSEP